MIEIEHPLDGRARLRIGPLSMRLGNLLLAAMLSLACLTATAISLMTGSTQFGFVQTLSAVLGWGSEEAVTAVRELRAPRLLIGALAGFVVSVVGAVLQTLARNPLADPGLLGVSQGAIVASMVLVILFPGLGAGPRAAGAVFGALLTGMLLLALIGPARAAGLAILLMGIAVETTLSSISLMLLIYTPPELSHQMSAWLMGALDRASWVVLFQFLPWTALVLPLLLLAGPSLRAYDLGDDLARSIGTPTGARRAVILLAAIVLAGASTAAVGPLMLLGVMGPHLARFLSPATGAARLWLSGLMGAFLVITADTVVRLLGPVVPLPLGLCLVLIGIPLSIASLRLSDARQSKQV